MTQRTDRLDSAVRAVRTYLDYDPQRVSSLSDPGPGLERQRLSAKAMTTVEAALKDGLTHTAIAQGVGVSGLAVAGLIADPQMLATALVRERHAAQRHLAEVNFAIRRDAVNRVLQGDRGAKSATAEAYKLSRVTLDKWLKEEADGTAPQTPWDDMRPGGEVVG